MEAGLQFAGVKSLCHVSSKRSSYLRPLCPKRLRFATSVASASGLSHSSVKSSCRSRVLKVSCEGVRVDVLERKETENQGFGEAENQMTCVMKFGGSSVANAERMREVAELILGFPNERPVIVLSAMGKTTNKLLLVCI
jgi:aspartate kinase